MQKSLLIVEKSSATGGQTSKCSGIRSFHDFVFTKHLVTGAVVSKVRKLCHSGAFEKSTIHVQTGRSIEECVIPDESESYISKNKLRTLSDTKVAHLKQMSSSFIPRERWLSFLY